MGRHEAGGSTLCIHSVVIKEDQRRKGLALKMLKVRSSLSLSASGKKHELLALLHLPSLPFWGCKIWPALPGSEQALSA